MLQITGIALSNYPLKYTGHCAVKAAVLLHALYWTAQCKDERMSRYEQMDEGKQ